MQGYDYSHVPTIRDFSNCDAFVRGLIGGFGGGKSTGCVWEIAQRGLAQKPGPDGVRRSRWAAVRNTYAQLEDSTIRTFHQWFPPILCGDWRQRDHSFVIRNLKNPKDDCHAEIEVNFRALDRPDQVGNLLSTEYTGGWINEGRDVPWEIFEALMGRVGRFPRMTDGGPTWSGIFSDTNPPDTDSRWYKFFEEMDHRDTIKAFNAAIKREGLSIPLLTPDTYRRCFKQPSGRGPQAENLKNLKPLYYEQLAVGKSAEWIKVYIDGEYGFSLDGRAVFPDYLDSVHCPQEIDAKGEPFEYPEISPDFPIVRSYDFGLLPACVWGQLTADGHWFVFDELSATDIMGFDAFSDAVLERSRRRYRGFDFEDVGDPAGNQRSQNDAKTAFGIAHAKGIRVQPAPQTWRTRVEGASRPMRLMVRGRPMFLIYGRRCPRLRKALMGGYHYRRVHVAGEVYENKPHKNLFSHIGDAFGYQGAWLFGQELQQGEPELAEYEAPAISDPTRSLTTGY